MHRLRPFLRVAALLAAISGLGVGTASAEPLPAPDPPRASLPDPGGPALRAPGGGSAGVPVEWTLHKTADGAHPDGDEQTFVWLMNRARQDPGAEGVFLATLDDPLVQSALSYFQVDLGVLEQEFAAIAPAPPAAFDARLYEAAYVHSLDLIARDAQDHNGQFTEVADAGFHYSQLRGNVFSYAQSPLYGHAGFNVDWGGSDGTGMQTGRGHRMAIMSIDGDYTNVGIAAVPESSPDTSVGPLVVTGNYANAASGYPDHYDRFLVGTVWEDLDADGLYDPGEGIADVKVTVTPGAWFAVTAAGGGYAVPIETAGPVDVVFSGGGVGAIAVHAEVGAESVLLDYPVSFPVPEPGAASAGGLALLALAGLTRARAPRRDGLSAAR